MRIQLLALFLSINSFAGVRFTQILEKSSADTTKQDIKLGSVSFIDEFRVKVERDDDDKKPETSISTRLYTKSFSEHAHNKKLNDLHQISINLEKALYQRAHYKALNLALLKVFYIQEERKNLKSKINLLDKYLKVINRQLNKTSSIIEKALEIKMELEVSKLSLQENRKQHRRALVALAKSIGAKLPSGDINFSNIKKINNAFLRSLSKKPEKLLGLKELALNEMEAQIEYDIEKSQNSKFFNYFEIQTSRKDDEYANSVGVSFLLPSGNKSNAKLKNKIRAEYERKIKSKDISSSLNAELDQLSMLTKKHLVYRKNGYLDSLNRYLHHLRKMKGTNPTEIMETRYKIINFKKQRLNSYFNIMKLHIIIESQKEDLNIEQFKNILRG